MPSTAPDVVLEAHAVAKYFAVYDKPSHRLWQMLFRGRRRFFRPYWALRDISFSLRRGESLGILGRNGAGKSTLLQILCGTLAPSSGTVCTRGRIAALLELGSGFNPEFTGRENVRLNAALLGLAPEEIEARYADIVAFADIGEFIDQPVKSYSSGMVVRLAFAVIAHVDADILVIDEALAVGDAFFTQKCMRFLRRFMAAHTLIFVSHDMAAVKSLCNRALLLDGGRIVMDGPPGEVCGEYLKNLYEASQGESRAPVSAAPEAPALPLDRPEEDYRDMRADLLARPPLRNDIRVFRFDPEGDFFGTGEAIIERAVLLDALGRPLAWVVGGEMVRLHIGCRALADISSPIVGFLLKDRTGQALFGDNTWLRYADAPLFVERGQCFTADFTFRMPILARGEYAISVAVAEGSQEQHVQHQWRHDALLLHSVSTSVPTGLMGIPMKDICLRILAPASPGPS